MNKTKKTLVEGDRWRLELESQKPGETYLMVYIDGEQQGKVPIGNVLEPLARFDPETAGAREQLVQSLRGQLGNLQSKVIDQTVNEATIGQLRISCADAQQLRISCTELQRDRAAALSELDRVRGLLGRQHDAAAEIAKVRREVAVWAMGAALVGVVVIGLLIASWLVK